MAYTRKPNYFFASEASTGINELAIGSILSVQSMSGTPKQFQKLTNTSLTSLSTLADALAGSNIQEIGTGTAQAGGTISVSTPTSDTDFYPLFVDVTTGEPTVTGVSSSKLLFNPSTGNLSSTTFTSLSDINSKKDVTNISIDVVDALRGVEFNWVDGSGHSAGVIAQELEEVLPFLIETNASGVKSVNYSGLIPYLIEAVKDLRKRVLDLEQGA